MKLESQIFEDASLKHTHTAYTYISLYKRVRAKLNYLVL